MKVENFKHSNSIDYKNLSKPPPPSKPIILIDVTNLDQTKYFRIKLLCYELKYKFNINPLNLISIH